MSGNPRILKSKIIAGQRFQALTALKRVENRNGKTIWLFRCDCGMEVERQTRNVLRNTKNSCGCVPPKFIDRTGEKHGKLYIKEFIALRNRRAIYLCVCDCGTEKELVISPILSGKTLSCGCYFAGRWKGKYTNKDGYVLVRVPHHPAANGGGYVFEHRLVIEKKIGRYLTRKENVHHKNGIRNDNREENLELWTKSQPYGQRANDLVAFALEVLKQYAPEYLKN